MPDAKAAEAMMKYNESLQKAGLLLALDGLHPPSMGARVSFPEGKPKVTDGPFAEAKGVLGGYWMIQVKSKEEAIEWASRCPGSDDYVIEVRQVQEFADFPADVQDAAAKYHEMPRKWGIDKGWRGGNVPGERASNGKSGRGLNVILWTVQWLLAAVFLLAGFTKLVLPIAEMTKQVRLPGLFLRFIGSAEVLGAIGLILPGLLHIRTMLTPLAAAGLVIITTGATVIVLKTNTVLSALLPLVTGLLAVLVAYGRWKLAPIREKPRDGFSSRPTNQ
jgi:uncharacterized membrane protein YphA (DoxX/SURF4 family)